MLVPQDDEGPRSCEVSEVLTPTYVSRCNLLDGGEGDDDVAAHCRVVLFLKTEGSRFTDVGDRENPFGDTQEARFLQQIKEKTPFSGNTRAG